MISSVRTPAKLNLGLEIIRKRPDGYHDLTTVFQAIELYDEFQLSKSRAFRYIGDARIRPETDIVRPILEQAATKQGWASTISIIKRIPIAAGLGGGSSDAALALKIAMYGERVESIREKARSIGADVPFFIDGGTALATGIGDELEQLPGVPLVFVLVTPLLDIPNKTASLFSGLKPGDFSDGENVRELGIGLKNNREAMWLIDRISQAPNAFRRQMLDQVDVRDAWRELESIAGRVALSGAGPTIYSWHTSLEEARNVVTKLGTGDRIVNIAKGITWDRHQEEQHAIRELRTLLAEQD